MFAAQVTDLTLPAEQLVTNLYEGFLQRGPDSQGLLHWTAAAGTTVQSRQQVLDAFAESEPFRELAGTLYRETAWLVADQLGTPRLVAERTGSLAGIRRHDYLPFGEELYSGAGGRTPTRGYSARDNVRQQFTQKERDTETGLDYIYARHYAGTQGRFTSCDPMVISKEHTVNPQRWNAYTYVLNSPLGLTDPTGKNGQGKSGAKVIDVFITHQSEERRPHRGANWSGLIEKAKQRRIVMRVFYRTEAGTGESEPSTAKITASLSSPGRIVIVAGHSDASHERRPARLGRWDVRGRARPLRLGCESVA